MAVTRREKRAWPKHWQFFRAHRGRRIDGLLAKVPSFADPVMVRAKPEELGCLCNHVQTGLTLVRLDGEIWWFSESLQSYGIASVINLHCPKGSRESFSFLPLVMHLNERHLEHRSANPGWQRKRAGEFSHLAG